MQRMGLSSADLAAYHRALGQDRQQRFRLSVYDMNGRILSTLDPDWIDGQIVVDVTTIPSRVLMVSFLDPTNAMNIDPDSPAPTGMHQNRQLRVQHSLWVEELGRWVTCTPFFGPVRYPISREANVVHVTAHGRETLGMGQMWTPKSWPKGTRKTAIIKALLVRYGDTAAGVPTLAVRSGASINAGRQTQPFAKARSVAASVDRVLIYPGTGVATLRRRSTHPVFSFTDLMLTPVQPQVNPSAPRVNAVEVYGPKPKGHKTQIRGTAVLDPSRPLSAAALAPDPGRVVHSLTIHNPHVRSTKEANRIAATRLREAQETRVDITFDAIPVYHLDEWDMVGAAGHWFGLRQFTIPLTTEGAPPMTVGTIRRTTRA